MGGNREKAPLFFSFNFYGHQFEPENPMGNILISVMMAFPFYFEYSRPLKICTWCHCEARERRGNLSDVNSL